MEELLVHAQRYGNTPAKQKRKSEAMEEISRRGPAALEYLMANVHLENLSIHLLTDQMVRKLESRDAVPILLKRLESENARTRRFAAYYLGFHNAPEHGLRLIPLLQDDGAAGAAIRTLGKWHVREAVPAIVPFMRSPKETRRIAAVNALRDIGDPVAAPQLIEALNDSVFTVRKTAARALVTFGQAGESALLESLPAMDETALREAAGALGALRSRRAIGALRRLLSHESWGVRADAALALSLIDRHRAPRWIRSVLDAAPADPSGPFVIPGDVDGIRDPAGSGAPPDGRF